MRKYNTEKVIEKMKNNRGNGFDYSEVSYVNIRTPVVIRCLKHDKRFSVLPDLFYSGKAFGCPECGKESFQKKSRYSQERIIENFKKAHGDKYDYSKVKYVNIDTPVEIICQKHGSFWQSPYEHYKGSDCPKCLGRGLTTEEWVEKAKGKYGDKFDYSTTDYKGATKKIRIICNTCKKEFDMTPNNHMYGRGNCPYCVKKETILKTSITKRKNSFYKFSEIIKEKYGDKYKLLNKSGEYLNLACNNCGNIFTRAYRNFLRGCECPVCAPSGSIAERRITEYLNGRDICFEPEHHFDDLKIKEFLRYDFYIPDKKLLIEYNGEQHYKWISYFHETYKEFLFQKHRDWLKRKYARDNGIRLLIIPYWDFDKIEGVLNEEIG